jgi:hypothetical protein
MAGDRTQDARQSVVLVGAVDEVRVAEQATEKLSKQRTAR